MSRRLPTGPLDAAVVDLWETLVPLPRSAKDGAFLATADALGVPAAELRDPWTRTRRARETGDLASYLRDLGTQLGHRWTPAQLDAAMAARRRHHGVGFEHPHEDGLRLLEGLRRRGVPVAVVSNCSSDVAGMIAGSAIGDLVDVAILSARTGAMKPDVAVFRAAADALGADPVRCLYVGDGLDDELGGATSAGMHAVLVERGTPARWDGPRVRELTELLDLPWATRAPSRP